MECEIVLADLNNDEIVKTISEILTEASSKFSVKNGGHVPDSIVTDIVHKYYTSVDSIKNTFSKTGHRFILIEKCTKSIIGTILISKSPDTILVVDSKNINVDKKHFPSFCPENYHHIFNLAIKSDYQKKNIGKFFIKALLEKYRHLFSGNGAWLHAEPPFHDIYPKLGFFHNTTYDVFLPEDAVIPEGYVSVSDFNKKHICNCLRPKEQLDISKKCRYKYGVFTIDF